MLTFFWRSLFTTLKHHYTGKGMTKGEARYVNVQWSVHWGGNYQVLLALLKNPSSVHLIGAYCKWRGLSTKDPSVSFVDHFQRQY